MIDKWRRGRRYSRGDDLGSLLELRDVRKSGSRRFSDICEVPGYGWFLRPTLFEASESSVCGGFATWVGEFCFWTFSTLNVFCPDFLRILDVLDERCLQRWKVWVSGGFRRFESLVLRVFFRRCKAWFSEAFERWKGWFWEVFRFGGILLHFTYAVHVEDGMDVCVCLRSN